MCPASCIGLSSRSRPFRGVALGPPPDSCVVQGEAALTHHLFDVAVGKLVSTIPVYTQKNDRRLEVAPLERRLVQPQGDVSEGKMDELRGEV